MPAKPCSGEKSAAILIPAASIRSILRFPSRLKPVWLVIRPMRFPRKRREILLRQNIQAGEDRGFRLHHAVQAGPTMVSL